VISTSPHFRPHFPTAQPFVPTWDAEPTARARSDAGEGDRRSRPLGAVTPHVGEHLRCLVDVANGLGEAEPRAVRAGKGRSHRSSCPGPTSQRGSSHVCRHEHDGRLQFQERDSEEARANRRFDDRPF
jgi:hypothetical protein